MPSGITLDSLNLRLEGSYLILFLLPFGVSMVTTIRPELCERPLFAAVPEWRFKVNASFLAHHSGDERSRS